MDNEIIIISVGSQGLRGFMKELVSFELRDEIFVLCMKGLETETEKRLSRVALEICHESSQNTATKECTVKAL